MSEFIRCSWTKYIFLLLPLSVSTVSASAQQLEANNTQIKTFTLDEDHFLEMLNSKKGLISFLTIMIRSLFEAWGDIKDSVEDIKALIEFIFWLEQEELEDEMTMPPLKEYQKLFLKLLESPAIIFIEPELKSILVLLADNQLVDSM